MKEAWGSRGGLESVVGEADDALSEEGCGEGGVGALG